MNCCKCNKELDVETSDIPPKWFGVYVMSDLKRVICHDCIKKPENKEWCRIDFDKRKESHEQVES